MKAESETTSGQQLRPVREGSSVEVCGRLFTGTDGHTYARPRLHPDEPHTSLREQAEWDSTPNRIRVTGLGTQERQFGGAEGSWHTIRGILRGMCIEANAVLDPPEHWLDTWAGAASRYSESDPHAPTEWFLSPDRQEFLERIFAMIDERKDFCPRISSGLSGTDNGTFCVNINIMAINESFAAWAENYSPDDLLVRSFVRAL